MPAPSRIVLGLGGTLDLEVDWDATVLEQRVTALGIHPDDVAARPIIASESDLVCSLLDFVATGAGGERFVTSTALVESFAAHFRYRIALGGTCVRAALGMHRIGVSSTVHLVSTDEHVRRLLPPGVEYVSSATGDSTHPHLITQFPAGTRVRVQGTEIVAPRANRAIYVHDPPNRELRLAPELGAVLRDARVFLVSGLNSIQDEATLAERLVQLREHIAQLPPTTTVIYEDAGFHIPEFSRRVRDALAPEVGVYSMNEDEMQAHLGRRVDPLDPRAIEAAALELHGTIGVAHLVIHSAHWALAVGERAADLEPCLRGGVTLAATRYRLGDDYDDGDYHQTGMMAPHPEGERLASDLRARLGTLVCCVPAPQADVADPTTIGLGDTFIGGFIAALASP